jgi:hypothetical protein
VCVCFYTRGLLSDGVVFLQKKNKPKKRKEKKKNARLFSSTPTKILLHFAQKL